MSADTPQSDQPEHRLDAASQDFERSAAPAVEDANSSFYNNLELDLETPPAASAANSSALPALLASTQPVNIPLPPTPSATTPTSTPASPFAADSNNIAKYGTKKTRTNPGSNISRRITMLAAGKNENNSDEHTVPSPSDYSSPHPSSSTGRDSPDPSDYPDSFFEELLRQDQTTLARSQATMPKPTPRPTINNNLGSKYSMPIRLPSATKNGDEADDIPPSPAFVSSGDTQEDLRRLEVELTKSKETKSKAEADAKAQRTTVMSLKTELQLVRNVLKRRETELGDVKDMSAAYESELAELRQKLEKAERQLSKGQGEMEAKVRALERMRDESIERIQILDRDIKKLRDQLEEAEKKSAGYQSELHGLREELEELEPYRVAAQEQRELNATEPARVLELSSQITDLEDTRDIQAALIEQLETKISTVEAEALEFKGKAELEYEALSDGFKVLKTRRSEEIKVLKAELEQHKLQEQIIEKLQADIDLLQSALASVATSQTTENARINQVTAELNEALALKDQEVVQVRQNMTEFEDSHNRLVSSLQATLATINDEADAARKSRDEAVLALESLREELEALRHSLPINSKHMSLSQWSQEQQQSQQEQLKAIQDLEEKLDGQVVGVKEEQQRAGILEANTKRKSQQLTLDMEHHLQLSNAIVQKSSAADKSQAGARSTDSDNTVPPVPTIKDVEETSQSKDLHSSTEPGTVSVRMMLKFLSQLQGRPSSLSEKETHIREGTEATIAGDAETDYESQLRVYLTNVNDPTLMEPWGKEKELEKEIDQLEHKIQSLLSDLTAANQKGAEAQIALESAKERHEAELQEERDQRDELERLEREEREEIEQKALEERQAREEEILREKRSLESKSQELLMKETSLREREQSLQAKEDELVKEELELQKRAESFPVTPPFSAPMTPFGSPGNNDLSEALMAAHQRSRAKGGKGDDSEDEGEDVFDTLEEEKKKRNEALERQQQADMAAQQIKLIKSLEDKIVELEKRPVLPPTPAMDDVATFPSPLTAATPRSSAILSRIGSQSIRSSLLGNPPDTPPPTIALPPIPSSSEYNANNSSDESLSSRKKAGLSHTIAPDALVTKAAMMAATEAAVAAAVAKSMEAHNELMAKLEKSEAELNASRNMNKELELELTNAVQTKNDNANNNNKASEFDMQKLKQENAELAQVLEEIRRSLDQAQNHAQGLESLKSQLEAQVKKERQAKDDALRAKDRLQTQLEEEMQKKKGGFLCF
ncbi:hypothetical protein BGZ99_005817 [Dissophora globulifera]|uniref:Uncharacterized protein n=1 Tax=Dissophora globulifera TaxID=979702 RepID=A0A9P6RDS6_9FUNG|nr:hypothetical protein BGZ99_005817 [Dissophora globulifera]